MDVWHGHAAEKGLHLNQIHNLERSFEEMMLGLEVWIPMYMTGQISPYYIKNTQSSPVRHLLKVSGAAALSGEAIAGHHSQGRYYLTKARREVAYYSKQAQALLDNASPLMEIYRGDRANEFNAFLLADAPKSGKRRDLLPAPIHHGTGDLDRLLRRQTGGKRAAGGHPPPRSCPAAAGGDHFGGGTGGG